MPSPGIPPHFGPSSGWYQPGQYGPTSAVAKQEMRKAALPATVVVLRRRGVRIPTWDLLNSDPPAGLLLAMDKYTHPHWHACLFAEGMEQELLPKLMHARLERENEGVRLYGGVEFADNGRSEFRQAWLCAPTPGRLREILLELLEQEGGAPP